MIKRMWIGAILLLALAGLAQAQTYPSKPIRMIVGASPGGGMDTTARIFMPPLAERLGQPIAIENKPGASTSISLELAAHAEPDGYTLFLANASGNAINPYIYTRVGYDPIKSFTPIVLLWTVPSFLTVSAASPFKTVQDLVAYARANPGKLNLGTGGIGSSQHLGGVILSTAAKIDIVSVHYKSAGPSQVALIGGHVDLMVDSPPSLALVAGGKLRALAVTSKTRSSAAPNVPTFDELGIPGVHFEIWYAIAGPAGIPRPIVERLNKEANAVLQTLEMKKRTLDFSAQIRGGTPEELERFMISELERYRAVVKASGVKAE